MPLKLYPITMQQKCQENIFFNQKYCVLGNRFLSAISRELAGSGFSGLETQQD